MSPQKRATAEDSGFPVRVWMLIYALSGFIALALEIVWFRLLGVLQKSTSFTFPTLLAVYLGGLALGVMIGVPLARRIRRPAVIFLALQSGITLYAGALRSRSFFATSISRAFLKPLWVYLGGYEPVNAADLLALSGLVFRRELAPALLESARFVLFLYFVLPFVLIAPATLLMGVSFPVLQKLVQDNPMLLGRRVGWLQTLNIVGSMLGAHARGLGFVRWLGSSGTLKLLVFLGGIFLCLAAWQLTRRPWVRWQASAALVGLVGWLAAACSHLAEALGETPRRRSARNHRPRGRIGIGGAQRQSRRLREGTVWVFSKRHWDKAGCPTEVSIRRSECLPFSCIQSPRRSR